MDAHKAKDITDLVVKELKRDIDTALSKAATTITNAAVEAAAAELKDNGIVPSDQRLFAETIDYFETDMSGGMTVNSALLHLLEASLDRNNNLPKPPHYFTLDQWINTVQWNLVANATQTERRT